MSESGFGLCVPKEEGAPKHPFDLDCATIDIEKAQYLAWKKYQEDKGRHIPETHRMKVYEEA